MVQNSSPEHQADEKYVVVGAASILAKTYSDFQYVDHYQQGIWCISVADRRAILPTRRFVWQHRHNPPPIVRTSWHYFKVILSQLERFEHDPLYVKKTQSKKS